jgi:hypothetical protein
VGLLGYISAVQKKTERKPAEKRRTEFLRVRLTAETLTMIQEAAESAGITVSAWATERLVRAARQERRAAEKS